MADLILTNGDTAADLLAAAGRTGTILPWRDVLHEGPVVAGPIEASSTERVAYLARRFRIPPEDIAIEFRERDAIMRAHANYERIELWFEHDLYDQLQLVQILSFLAEVGRTENVALVQADDFLGAQTAETILSFESKARAITRHDLDLGRTTWAALASHTPEAVAHLAENLDTRLPFLKPSLRRFLEELPAPVTGLGRTETEIVEGIAHGTTAPLRLFQETIRQEEAAFMGDWSFFHLLDDLASCDVPLIAGLAPAFEGEDNSERFREAVLELTMAGEDVANAEEDHVALSGLDRWWCGTHLAGRTVWRYDRTSGKLVAPVAA
ncbi:MAG: hypothetical protein WDM94_09570 [Bauldia sp.]